MKLGDILKKLSVGEVVTITVAESEYSGKVIDQGYTESKPDPVKPWYDPGGASAVIELDESTVGRFNLNTTKLKVTCGQYDGYPAWKTPEAVLIEDEETKSELGEVSDIQTDDS
jgi:hypothetical protein